MTRVALRGGRWVALQSVGLQVLSVITTAILTRLLAPEDFGIIAVTTVLVGLFSLVNSFGLNASVIRRPDLDDTILATFFWLAVILGAAATGILVFASVPLASSFGQSASAPYVAAMAPVLLLSLVRSVPGAVLSRQLRFGPVAGVAVVDFLAYAIVAVSLAATTDLAAWAIVIGRLVGAATSLLAMFALAKWRPRAQFRWSAVREDILFNVGVMANGIAGFLSRNLDYWVVGRLGARELGVYYIAYLLPNVLRRRLTIVGTDVMFPILSRLTDDRERFGRGFLDSVRLLSMTGFPMMFGLAAVADAVVPLTFGSAFASGAEPASILAVASGFSILLAVTAPVFLADGVPLRSAGVGAFRVVVTGVGLLIALDIGTLEAAAWAVLVGTLASVIALLVLVLQRLPIRGLDILKATAPATVSSVAMVAVVLAVKRVAGTAALDWPGFIAVVAIGVVAYLGFGLVAFRSSFLQLFKNLKTVVGSSGKRPSSDPATEDTAQKSQDLGGGDW